MKSLTILQNIIPTQKTKPNQFPQILQPFLQTQNQPPFPQSRSWQLHSGPKGFTGNPKEITPAKSNRRKLSRNINDNDEDDDKIPEVVWERMIKRILLSTGVPLVSGFALLQIIGFLKEGGLWDVPKWVPFFTTLVTFGASALGIAYGSLSTSLSAESEGSLFGIEQFEKNWDEMWQEEEEEENGESGNG